VGAVHYIHDIPHEDIFLQHHIGVAVMATSL
jgi:hypothetical protein